jgi:hypothetical protein
MVPGNDVAGAPLHDDRLDLPEPGETCRDRGDIAAARVSRVKLHRVDRDDESLQLGRDVGGRSAVGVDGGWYGERGWMRCHARRTGD